MFGQKVFFSLLVQFSFLLSQASEILILKTTADCPWKSLENYFGRLIRSKEASFEWKFLGNLGTKWKSRLIKLKLEVQKVQKQKVMNSIIEGTFSKATYYF